MPSLFWPIKLYSTISFWFPNICFHLKKKSLISLLPHYLFSFLTYLLSLALTYLLNLNLLFEVVLFTPSVLWVYPKKWPFPFDSGTQLLYIISHFIPFNMDYIPANKAGQSICPYDKYLLYICTAYRVELCPVEKE